MAAHLCGALWLLGGSVIFFPAGGLVLFTILGPLIIWKSKGDTRPFVAAQANEALNFQITILLLGIVGALLIPILIGIAILWVLGLVSSYTMGGFIHILLVLAVAVVLIRIIQGRKPI